MASGLGLIAFSVLSDGFQGTDVLFLLLPFAAVLAGFFFARGRLANRGALQLLTLGFGALAPRREGEPARCRRCQGPLPSAGLGGVSQCRYCGSENIVGLDLRPSVNQARAEQQTFDVALRARASEKRLWTTLTVVAAIALLGWAAGTVAYMAGIEKGSHAGRTGTARGHDASAPRRHDDDAGHDLEAATPLATAPRPEPYEEGQVASARTSRMEPRP